jgi:hypothetical protein
MDNRRQGNRRSRLRDRTDLIEEAEDLRLWPDLESDPIKDADATVAELAAEFRHMIGLSQPPQHRNSK